MAYIILDVYSTRHIGREEYAMAFYDLLEKYNILPEKINFNIPVNKEYTLDTGIDCWTYTSGSQPDFRLGMIVAKRMNPNIKFDVYWSIGERARINSITFWFTKKSFREFRSQIENFFKDLIICLDACYGCITDYNRVPPQSTPGTLETRLNGIYWCNYFGNIYVDFFGADKMLSASWYKTEKFDKHGIIAFMTEDIFIEPEVSEKLESRIKEELGKDAFGDVEEYSANLQRQYRRVPEFDLSEIRQPLSSFNIKDI